MTQQTDLAEIIIEKSSELFREQGYPTTTINQIGKAAVSTTADESMIELQEVFHLA